MSLSFDRLLNFYEAANFDPVTMTTIALASTVASTGIGAAGTIAAGQNAATLGRYQQQEYEQQAETATATGQRSMLEERRKEALVESTLQTRAAAGGGSATAPSTLNVASRIAGRGEYNALMDLSQGENQAAGLRDSGNAALYSGKLAQTGDDLSALGTIAGGAGSFASTYMYGMGRVPFYGAAGAPMAINQYALGR